MKRGSEVPLELLNEPFRKKYGPNGNMRYNVPTSNTYAALNTVSNNTTTNNENSKNKKNQLPPIVVKASPSQTMKILNELKITKFIYKNTTIGTKVWLYDESEYKAFSNKLKTTITEYFSFSLEKDKYIKFVLFGLPNIETTILTKEIESHGLKPLRIDKYIPKALRRDEDAIYFVYFQKATTTLSKLQFSLRTLAHCVCKWEVALNKKKNPAQCQKCYRFGHGSTNCGMISRCKYCTVDHGEVVCPLIEETERHKCANCSGNHVANSITCPKRAEYLEMKKRMDQRPNNNVNIHEVKFADTDFPDRLSRSISTPQDRILPAVNHGYASPSYASTSSERNNMNSNNYNNLNLYNSNEILIIFRDVVNSLKGCRTKEEQFYKIAELAVKYVN